CGCGTGERSRFRTGAESKLNGSRPLHTASLPNSSDPESNLSDSSVSTRPPIEIDLQKTHVCRQFRTKAASLPATVAGWSTSKEEHTSELQSRFDLVCRLLLEKKKK